MDLSNLCLVYQLSAKFPDLIQRYKEGFISMRRIPLLPPSLFKTYFLLVSYLTLPDFKFQSRFSLSHLWYNKTSIVTQYFTPKYHNHTLLSFWHIEPVHFSYYKSFYFSPWIFWGILLHPFQFYQCFWLWISIFDCGHWVSHSIKFYPRPKSLLYCSYPSKDYLSPSVHSRSSC